MLIWYASSLGFDIRAKWTVIRLNSLNPKIKAMCHPPWLVYLFIFSLDFVTSFFFLSFPSFLRSPFLWSHHQKFVVVDDLVAFVGGVDLCFGRYEDKDYSVVDQGKGEEGWGGGFEKFPGRDYLNFNVPGATETNGSWDEEVLDRNIYPRTPWYLFSFLFFSFLFFCFLFFSFLFLSFIFFLLFSFFFFF